MPLTNDQITNFTKRAKAAGASDAQIATEIARKQAEVAEIDRVNSAAQSGILSPEKAFEAGADLSVLEEQKSKQAQEAKKPLLNAVQELINADTKPITGALQIRSMIPGTKAQLTKKQFEQLQSMLSLESREKLKGSGAISDFEAKILADSASTLSRSLSDDDFKAQLNKMLVELDPAAKQSAGTQKTPAGKVSMQSPDGKVYQVDEAEAEEAAKNGWKRF